MPKAPTIAQQRRRASKAASAQPSSKQSNWLKFNSRMAEGRDLSNFAQLMVHINGETYFTGEAAFHCEKMKCVARHMPKGERRDRVLAHAEQFLTVTDPAEAKKMGSKRGMPLSQEELEPWDTTHAFLTQRGICNYKCRTYPQILELLKESKGRPLLHLDCRARESNVWGGRVDKITRKLVGQNQLGKIWMQMRETWCGESTE